MSSNFHHIRTQRPVGQGLFHTGTIKVGGKAIRYVYDCGAVAKEPREREVNYFLKRPEIIGEGGAKEGIDILFLSHFHSDHVNGVMALVEGTRNIDTVVMPYLSEFERLNFIIASIVSSAGSTETGITIDYINFMQSPSNWFREREVENIIIVRGTDDHEGGTETPSPEIPPSETLLEVLRIRTDKLEKVKPPEDAAIDDEHVSDRQPFFIEAIDISGTSYYLDWTLWVFVPSDDRISKQLLLEELIKENVFANIGEARTILADASLIAKHMTKHGKQGKVVKAYENLIGKKKLNQTSMCLYSGPLPYLPHHNRRGTWDIRVVWRNTRYFWEQCTYNTELGDLPYNCRTGWIGTGDANFNFSDHMGQFSRHYNSVKPFVCSITIPHHGSHENFHPDLLNWAYWYVISAGRNNSYGHPDRSVSTAILDQAGALVWVNEDHETAFIESIRHD